MNQVFERCFVISRSVFQIRVWTESEDLGDVAEETEQRVTLMMAIQTVLETPTSRLAKVVLAEQLAKIAFVSAVEVRLNGDSAAAIIYNNWP